MGMTCRSRYKKRIHNCSQKPEGEKQLGRPGYWLQDSTVVTRELKVKIVEQEVAVARQQHGKHVSTTTE
jgi:hypothetical protein